VPNEVVSVLLPPVGNGSTGAAAFAALTGVEATPADAGPSGTRRKAAFSTRAGRRKTGPPAPRAERDCRVEIQVIASL
jgi:hypothetical protein